MIFKVKQGDAPLQGNFRSNQAYQASDVKQVFFGGNLSYFFSLFAFHSLVLNKFHVGQASINFVSSASQVLYYESFQL